MFHIVENGLITIERTDKEGHPIERHLVQSFTRPIGQTGSMTIEAVSVRDLANSNNIAPVADISTIAGIAIPGRSAASKVVE